MPSPYFSPSSSPSRPIDRTQMNLSGLGTVHLGPVGNAQ